MPKVQNTKVQQIKNYLVQNPQDVYLGTAVLAEKIGINHNTVQSSFRSQILSDFRKLRPRSTPEYWNKNRPYQKSDRNQYLKELAQRKLEQEFTGYTEERVFSDVLETDVIVFGRYQDLTRKYLSNGLGHFHKENCDRLLGKYQRVTSVNIDGFAVSTDQKGITLATDSTKNLFKYSTYKKLQEGN